MIVDSSNHGDRSSEQDAHPRPESGKSTKGGDLAPPNKDDAGRVVAPEKGEPDGHSH